jgi:hypothetical protein
VEYLLQNGIYTKMHANADPNYINIGDSSLIMQRNVTPIGITPPGGNLGEYVPFYFGPLSPMLFNIKTGYRGVTQRPQSDIVYICCSANGIISTCAEWCFTDGHAKTTFTEFYNDMNEIDNVDWSIVSERYWRNTDDDYDRMRRKQAEFLVKSHVPATCISQIVVYTEQKRIFVQNIVNQLKLNIPVSVNTNYYYH